ncbi:peptide chain release factor N(5)-glutamine methyltransferase [Candidatus Peregrinibacteria bacterium]|nr:peptide chain release factor N(5)-glutamine methyltransferase [Candidatus Peregrinibacteria bacterium]
MIAEDLLKESSLVLRGGFEVVFGTSEKPASDCNFHALATNASSLLSVSSSDTASSRVQRFRSKRENLVTKSGFSEVPFLECELLLATVLDVSREKLFLRYTEELRPVAEEAFRALFFRRMRGEPLAYILEKKEFYGLEFFVDRRVMIPRPETEMLVEWVLSKADEYKKWRDSAQGSGFFLADVGTGSGNIAISVAKNIPSAKISALDISDGALEVCEKNAVKHGVADRLTIVKSDLLSVFLEGNDGTRSEIASSPERGGGLLRFARNARNDSGLFIIAANLPYIGTSKNRYIARSVEDFEPHEALFGGMDGLEWYRRLFRQISVLKILPRYVIGEIGFTQGEAILEEIRSVFPRGRAEVKEDLAGLPRMFVLEI